MAITNRLVKIFVSLSRVKTVSFRPIRLDVKSKISLFNSLALPLHL
jgi:hypothetical protein